MSLLGMKGFNKYFSFLFSTIPRIVVVIFFSLLGSEFCQTLPIERRFLNRGIEFK